MGPIAAPHGASAVDGANPTKKAQEVEAEMSDDELHNIRGTEEAKGTAAKTIDALQGQAPPGYKLVKVDEPQPKFKPKAPPSRP